jgi:hypothetical protein
VELLLEGRGAARGLVEEAQSQREGIHPVDASHGVETAPPDGLALRR